ncbi:MAG: acetylxylan esterase [Terricaulis sp.]
MPHFTRRALLSTASAALLGCATETVAPAPLAPPVTFTTEEDHANMMAQLGITQLRPGRNGLDPTHPNYANYDESRANPYPTLPDPLRTKDGRAVTTAQMWWNVRRPEIAEYFEREIYGRVPANTPSVRWEVIETKEEMAGAVRTNVRRLTGHVDNAAYPAITVDMDMQIVLPADAAGPVPIVLNFLWINPPPFLRNLPPEPSPTWRDLILAKGWGYAILVPNSIQDDNGAGLTRGIIGLCNRGQPRRPEDWGALRAWGWGAGKAIEFFASDPAIDERRVALQGHSRYGKAALVTMAFDERIACGFISSSGMGGANLARRNWGEIVENLAGSGEYHWMAGNYIKYGGPLNAGDMPVDAHELIALCAPRPVFISSGAQEGDGWVDARGMFMAAAGAGPVYRLLGKRDLGTTTFPPIETTLIDGDVAYRQHSGGHTPGPNWPVFLDYAARYFGAGQ